MRAISIPRREPVETVNWWGVAGLGACLASAALVVGVLITIAGWLA
jgi:hypothetical protein